MKISTKLKILGFFMIPVGITLIVLGCTVFSYYTFDNSWFGKTPHMGAVIPGAFICFLSIPILVMGFSPSIAKMGVKLHNETLDKAGSEMGTAMKKTADIASPAITKVVKSVKEGFKEQTMFCKKCGKEITADSDFCKFCGINQK